VERIAGGQKDTQKQEVERKRKTMGAPFSSRVKKWLENMYIKED
jgi:hypothetical protein